MAEKNLQRERYLVAVVEEILNNGDVLCSSKPLGRKIYINFPKGVIEKLNLQLGESFIYYPQDKSEILLENCFTMAEGIALQKKEFEEAFKEVSKHMPESEYRGED